MINGLTDEEYRRRMYGEEPMTKQVPTHIFCDSCGGIVRFKEQEASGLDISGKFNGYDLVCENDHIIATLFEEVK